jgi:4,5-epoxidase
MTRLVLGESPIARTARDRLFIPLMNRPLVQRLIWEQACQLKVSYRRGRWPGGRTSPSGATDAPVTGYRTCPAAAEKAD